MRATSRGVRVQPPADRHAANFRPCSRMMEGARRRTVSVVCAEPSSGPEEAGPRPSLSDPVQTLMWGGTLPSARRAVLGGLSGVAIALGGNLGGCSSFLLGLDGGQFASRTRLDVLIPVRGCKRCVDYNYGFEFTYPSSWLADQTLAYRAAQRAEAARGPVPWGMEASSASASRRRAAGRAGGGDVAEPSVAFGPPGTTGEENVSVIVAPIAPGFSLRSLGDPRSAGERFLTTIAPEGSGLQAELLAASERTGGGGSGGGGQQLYYSLEYTVRSSKFFRHNVSVYTARNNVLHTFNAQCPEARWAEDQVALQASAASFQLVQPASP